MQYNHIAVLSIVFEQVSHARHVPHLACACARTMRPSLTSACDITIRTLSYMHINEFGVICKHICDTLCTHLVLDFAMLYGGFISPKWKNQILHVEKYPYDRI
jgi:hypothetical protein